MSRDDAHVLDILEAARRAEVFVGGMTDVAFLDDIHRREDRTACTAANLKCPAVAGPANPFRAPFFVLFVPFVADRLRALRGTVATPTWTA